jgi:hypothetical protein
VQQICDFGVGMEVKSSGCPPDSSIEAVIFVHCVLEFFPIFVLGFDLVFPEFRAVPSDDVLE